MAGRNDAIGTGSIVLSVNADRVVGGLVRVGRTVEGWASGLKSRMGGSGILDALTPSGMVARVGAVTGTVLGVGAAIQNVHDIAKQGAIADAMGMTAEQFTGIAGVAKSVGEDTREFIESLVTLGKVADEGAAGKGEVAPDFFKKLNIDAKEFKALRPDEMFFRFFEAVQKVQDPLQRTRLMMVAFGEDGGKWLLPLLSKTPGELRKMAGGFAITTEKMEQARAASLRLLEAQAKFRMMWNNITIAAAPVFEFLAEELQRMVGSFTKVGDSAKTSIGDAIRLTAKLADATKAASGAMLTAAGLRLKYFEAEIVARSALYGASTGGWKGALAGAGLATAGIAAGELIAGKELATIKAAGGVMYDLGRTMLRDVGNTVKAAEEFIKRLEARKAAAKAGGWLDPIFNMQLPAPPAPYMPPAKFAESVLKGTKEAYSLEMRHKFGLDGKADPAKAQLEQLKKLNKNAEKQTAKLDRLPVVRINVV